jgi:16S rRNA G1207 methylase RsmC
MAKYGASKVTAIDILNTAIQNVRQNIRLHNLKNVSSRRSNLFQNIEENKLFDLIITNFPIFLNDGRDGFNLFTDKKTVNRIFKNCKSHLKKNGKIILPYTQINDLKTIDYKKEALKNGFNFRVIGTQDIIYDNKKVGVSVLYQFYL